MVAAHAYDLRAAKNVYVDGDFLQRLPTANRWLMAPAVECGLCISGVRPKIPKRIWLP